MRTFFLILFIVISFFFLNCKKELTKSDTVDADIDIRYKNNIGNDLLNPSTPNCFLSDKIHVYNLDKGVKQEVNYPNYQYPHNFFVYKADTLDVFYLRLFVEKDTTLLELNSSITDTIICLIDKSDSYLVITKVWYNGILKWDNFSTPRFLTITK